MTKNENSVTTRDPVCGMRVDEAKCQYTSTYGGKKYHFCSLDCRKAFDLSPEKWVQGPAKPG